MHAYAPSDPIKPEHDLYTYGIHHRMILSRRRLFLCSSYDDREHSKRNEVANNSKQVLVTFDLNPYISTTPSDVGQCVNALSLLSPLLHSVNTALFGFTTHVCINKQYSLFTQNFRARDFLHFLTHGWASLEGLCCALLFIHKFII